MPNPLGKSSNNLFTYIRSTKLRWMTRTNQKRKVTMTLAFGLFGFVVNLVPLEIGEGLETFFGSLFSTVPALAFGSLPGIASGIIAAIPLAINKHRNIHCAVQLLHTFLISGLVKNLSGREYLLEMLLTFWLVAGWLLSKVSVLSPDLVQAERLATILCSVLGVVNGTSLAFGFLLTLPTYIWRELVPIGSYINRISAGILTTIIVVITSLLTSHAASLGTFLGVDAQEQFTYELLNSWLAGILLLVLVTLVVTRLIMRPLTRSLRQLARLSAVNEDTFDTLTDLRKFRPRIYEFNILRRHFYRVLTSLERTIASLKDAQIRISDQNEHLIEQTIQMEYAAKRDFLTGLLNLRSLESHMAMIWPLVRSGHLDIGILLIDTDHFKNYNDTYGHLAGNNVLADLAPILLSNVRNDDIVARFGGEEFVVVVHYVNDEQCRLLAERIRKAVETSDLGITVSIGCAHSSIEDTNWEDVLDRADTALYRAKEKGRNRVEYELP